LDIDFPLTHVLVRMHMLGVLFDPAPLEALNLDVSRRLMNIKRQVWETYGQINLQSSQQVAWLLYDKLGLPRSRETKYGYTTNNRALQQLARFHPAPQLVFDYRKLFKLRQSYINALPDMVWNDGRLHTDFNQTRTITGRLSSSRPNLQNIPMRTPLGRQLRKCFVASPGYKFVSADYSNIEMRMMAHLSNDQPLIDAFHTGKDVHAETAKALFRKSVVNDDERFRGKKTGFGIIYGVGPDRLGEELLISPADAGKLIGSYFDSHPGVRRFFIETLDLAREQGYVSSIFNRRRYLPDIRSEDGYLRKKAELAATNTPVQSSAADLIKIAMVKLQKALDQKGSAARIILQVHDELVVEAPEAEVEDVARLTEEVMVSSAKLRVPLEVSVGTGDNLYELK